MPALKPTTFKARIVWLGHVADSTENLRAVPVQSIFAGFTGIEGDCHGGHTRPACVRTSAQYAKGTEIRNVRQLSVLSQEELDLIAAEIGLDCLDPTLLGASMVIEGIPDFTHVPPASRLQTQAGTSITIDMENRPCLFPAKEIETETPGHGKAFKAAATGRRGVTAWVEREGLLRVGDTVTLHVPDQPVWPHLDAARS